MTVAHDLLHTAQTVKPPKADKALTGMAKRIAPDATAVALNDPKDLEEFAASL